MMVIALTQRDDGLRFTPQPGFKIHNVPICEPPASDTEPRSCKTVGTRQTVGATLFYKEYQMQRGSLFAKWAALVVGSRSPGCENFAWQRERKNHLKYMLKRWLSLQRGNLKYFYDSITSKWHWLLNNVNCLHDILRVFNCIWDFNAISCLCNFRIYKM